MKLKYTRPRKNREVLRKLPYHRRKRLMNVHLSKELREELHTRSLPVRKGDTVIVTKGKNAGWQKKVIKVNLKKMKVQIEGIKTTKTDSTEIFHYIHPSNLVITSLGERDDRKKMFERFSKEEAD
ncbi:MAG: 50S ribosomal protein L24 [Candidatus Hodarchaeales archaeon]